MLRKRSASARRFNSAPGTLPLRYARVMLGDLKSHRLMYLKGVLFLGLGVIASMLLLMERPTVRVALLLAIAIWSFCRAYYFAFYVIERYVDPGFKFSGLGAFARYLAANRRRGQDGHQM